MSTFNVGLCEQRRRGAFAHTNLRAVLLNTHLNDNSFQLQQPIVFIWSD